MANQIGFKFVIIWSCARLSPRLCLTLLYMPTFLDLPSSASSSNFHFIIWTYPQLPVKLILIHLLGLTFERQFGCAFDFVTHIYLIRFTTLMPSWQGSKPFNRLDHLYLLILKSLVLLQQHFLDLYYFFWCFVCCPQFHFHLLIASIL